MKVKNDYLRKFEKELKGVYLLKAKEYYFRQLGKEKEVLEIDKKLERYDKAINLLNSLEKEIITEVYFKKKSLLQVSKEVGYSYTYCSRLKKETIKKLMYIMGIDYKE